ncbi:hypothetical protein NM962_18685 [Mycobacterium sp. SVM_VP21]|nr:hypothetical protein NM962_18685 [Mycobacterium sp. SVM_VP21]
MADFVSGLIPGGAGLVGALIGAVSAQAASRKTREADRLKRCVDRVLAAITEMERAYAVYAAAAASGVDGPNEALPLQGARRSYNQAVQMLNHWPLRNAAMRYQGQLTEFYLVYGQPRDPLDADRPVLTAQQLDVEHATLAHKLRNYERT